MVTQTGNRFFLKFIRRQLSVISERPVVILNCVYNACNLSGIQ
jgi:hypothetical protein